MQYKVNILYQKKIYEGHVEKEQNYQAAPVSDTIGNKRQNRFPRHLKETDENLFNNERALVATRKQLQSQLVQKSLQVRSEMVIPLKS